MTTLSLESALDSIVDPVPATNSPATASAVGRKLSALDRSLGYIGQRRFVFFCYEPRGEEVVWHDGQSYGFGFGGWRAFIDYVLPAAALCGLNVGGSGQRATHVLVVDRVLRHARFCDRRSAEMLVARQSQFAADGDEPCAIN
ncbi:MAG: hypothetical protein ABSH20_13260 [Tepidisphaeraceae bacterium]|jgi:hypothetical protein